MTIASFKSDKELISFARVFFRDRVGSFCKDVAICLTPRKKKGKPTEHAEFPALITCMGFADLLSGLYAGNIEGHDLKELKSYAARFMDAKHYDPHLLDILYLAFRHKIAHLASPYLVFDTATRKEFEGKKQRLVTWTVYHTKRAVPVELEDHPVKFLKKAASPNASSSAIACRPASG